MRKKPLYIYIFYSFHFIEWPSSILYSLRLSPLLPWIPLNEEIRWSALAKLCMFNLFDALLISSGPGMLRIFTKNTVMIIFLQLFSSEFLLALQERKGVDLRVIDNSTQHHHHHHERRPRKVHSSRDAAFRRLMKLLNFNQRTRPDEAPVFLFNVCIFAQGVREGVGSFDATRASHVTRDGWFDRRFFFYSSLAFSLSFNPPRLLRRIAVSPTL